MDSEQNRIGLSSIVINWLENRTHSKIMFDFVRLPNPIERLVFDWVRLIFGTILYTPGELNSICSLFSLKCLKFSQDILASESPKPTSQNCISTSP